jgi:hypothetical protein
VRGLAGHRRPQFVRQRRCHALIGIERQNPVVARQRRGVVLLFDVAQPVVDDDAVREPAGDGDGVVSTAGIDDDDLVGPGDRRQRRTEIGGFVLRDNRDRHLRHGGSVLEGR